MKKLAVPIIGQFRALTRENLYLGFANNKGADQPAHQHSLISTIIIPLLDQALLESITSKLATIKQNFKFLASLCK